MAFDQRFRKILPSLTQTCSNMDYPCAKGSAGCETAACDLDSSAAAGSLACIQMTYGRGIRTVLAEKSASIVVRSENQFSDARSQRISLRKHIYESAPDARSTSGVLACQRLKAEDRFGEYLGFVDLRNYVTVPGTPPGGPPRSPLAMAVLAPPKHHRDVHTGTILTGGYGPLFGGPAFPSTIYSMQDEETSGAACIHACLIMSLGMLADRGARLMGSHTLVCAAVPQCGVGIPEKAAEGLPKDAADGIMGRVPVQGMRLAEVLELLTQGDGRLFRVSPFLQKLGPNCRLRYVLRLIEAYAVARFPAIMAVNKNAWVGKVNDDTCRHGHAVVLLGVDTGRPDAEATLYVHDPGSQPYAQRSVSTCFGAARKYVETGVAAASAVQGDDRINLILLADESVQLDPAKCAARLMHAEPKFGDYAGSATIDGPDGLPDDYDLRVRLLDESQVASMLSPKQQAARVQPLPTLPKAVYWVFAGYRGGGAQAIWAFDATVQNGDCQWWRFLPEEDHAGWCKMSMKGFEAIRLYRDDGAAASSVPVSAGADGGQVLRVSAMTSSSDLSIREIASRMAGTGHDPCLDLMLLRDRDMLDLDDSRVTATEYLANPKSVDDVSDWLVSELQSADEGAGRPVSVAAFASYFPNIASVHKEKRDQSIQAMVNAVQIARTVTGRRNPGATAVVEAVCGSRFDTVHPKRGDAETRTFLIASNGLGALGRLVASLKTVTESLKNSDKFAGGEAPKYRIALELEPGLTYSLHDALGLEMLGNLLMKAHLIPNVGINLDIAHMRIADVSAKVFDVEITATHPGQEPVRLRDLILHAHIADHPFLHTRDQSLGTWTHVGQRSPYLPYLRLLAGCGARTDGGGFTRAVAVELEGCDRLPWLLGSLTSLKHLLLPE